MKKIIEIIVGADRRINFEEEGYRGLKIFKYISKGKFFKVLKEKC
jgi:hypothetical protein